MIQGIVNYNVVSSTHSVNTNCDSSPWYPTVSQMNTVNEKIPRLYSICSLQLDVTAITEFSLPGVSKMRLSCSYSHCYL